MLKNSQNSSINILENFQTGLKWNFWGSFIFESLRILQSIMLMHCSDTLFYGTVGTLFATIYLATKIADAGASYTIHPFFYLFIKNKQSFRKLFFTYSLLINVPFFTGALLLFVVMISKQGGIQFSSNFVWIILIAIIVTETIRTFLRQFLHTAFKSKSIITVESLFFIGYLLVTWIPYCFFNVPLTLTTIFLPFLIDSLVVLFFFFIITMQFYKTLPSDDCYSSPPQLLKRLFSTRFFDFMLRLSKDLFATNILTPLFAYKCGLKEAGIFYLVSTITIALQTIIKTTIGHPGNALLASVKELNLSAKKQAFIVLSSRLSILALPILFLTLVCYKIFEKFFLADALLKQSLGLFACAYTTMIFADLFFMIYESFYVLEEKVASLCLIKLVEFFIFYFLITMQQFSLQTMILILLGIRFFSFLGIALHAYYMWQLIPSFDFSYKRFLSIGFSVSMIFLMILLW